MQSSWSYYKGLFNFTFHQPRGTLQPAPNRLRIPFPLRFSWWPILVSTAPIVLPSFLKIKIEEKQSHGEKHLLISPLLQPPSNIPSLPEIRITRLKPAPSPRVTLQPLMTTAVHGIRSIDHFLAQKVQLPNANPAMMPTPPREPTSSPQEPRAKGKGAHDRQRDGRIIERLRRGRVHRRQAKHDGDERDPETSDDGERFGRGAEVERSAFEVAGIDEAHGDGDAVGDVEADRGDGGRAVERKGRAEGREREEERAAGAEEDRSDW